MKVKISACDDTIKVDQAFVSGKERVTINGQVEYEGESLEQRSQQITVGNREYVIRTEKTSKIVGLILVHLIIREGGEVICDATYDHTGKEAIDTAEAKASGKKQGFSFIGCIIGVAFLPFFESAGFPGGMIGGAMVGLVGGGLGYGLGHLLFGNGS